MIRISVLYPRKEGASFDAAYFCDQHIPLVAKRLGAALKSVSVDLGVSGGSPETPPAFIAMAHLTFDSLPVYQEAFAPHAEEILGDIPNYTSIEPIIQINEVDRTHGLYG